MACVEEYYSQSNMGGRRKGVENIIMKERERKEKTRKRKTKTKAKTKVKIGNGDRYCN